ncbi:hypothetical protein [Methylobacterium sp. JK268]
MTGGTGWSNAFLGAFHDVTPEVGGGVPLLLRVRLPRWELDRLHRAFGGLEAKPDDAPAVLIIRARRPRHPETDETVAFDAALRLLEGLAAEGCALPADSIARAETVVRLIRVFSDLNKGVADGANPGGRRP